MGQTMKCCREFLSIISILFVANNCFADLTEGLIAHYALDGDSNDSSEGGNHGVPSGGFIPTIDRFGNANSAIQFDGVDDHIELPITSSSIGGEFTLSAWIYRTKSFDGNGKMGVISSDRINSNNRGAFLGISADEEVNTQVINSAGVGGPLIPAATWTLVTTTFDSNGLLNLYVNAQLEGSINSGGPAGGSTFFIGWDPYNFTPGTRHFGGKIDDVYIFNRALNPSEIQELLTGGSVETYEEAITNSLSEVELVVQTAPAFAFNNLTKAKLTSRKLSSSISHISRTGTFKLAHKRIVSDLLPRYDGCALDGVPDKNDWAEFCETQTSVFWGLLDAAELLNTALGHSPSPWELIDTFELEERISNVALERLSHIIKVYAEGAYVSQTRALSDTDNIAALKIASAFSALAYEQTLSDIDEFLNAIGMEYDYSGYREVAYTDPRIGPGLVNAGFVFAYKDFPSAGAKQYVVSIEGTAIEDWIDLVADFQDGITPSGYRSWLSGAALEGFLNYSDAIYDALTSSNDDILSDLRSGSKILITGHSLGGGVAHILGASLVRKGLVPPENIQVISFANPAPGDGQFVENFTEGNSEVNAVTYINRIDTVPNIPIFPFINNRHGEVIKFTRGIECLLLPTFAALGCVHSMENIYLNWATNKDHDLIRDF